MEDSLGSFSLNESDDEVWATDFTPQVGTFTFSFDPSLSAGAFGSITHTIEDDEPPTKATSPAISIQPTRRRPPRKRGFSCFGGGRKKNDSEDDAVDSDQDDDLTDTRMSISPPPTRVNFQQVSGHTTFRRRVPDVCKINSNINLGLLRDQQPGLFEEFRKYLVSQFCDENLACWEALLQLKTLDEAHFQAGLQNVVDTFIMPNSPQQIGCTEVYQPILNLLDNPPPFPATAAILTKIIDNLEFSSLQDPLVTWSILLETR
jgi:hypothetical protein